MAEDKVDLRIKEAMAIVDEEVAKRRSYRLVEAVRQLRAAEAVVRRLEKRVREIAEDDVSVFP